MSDRKFRENKENMKRKARTRVAPFRNRNEFISTMEKVYSEDIEERKEGLEMLQIWKIRRGAETSASILSTAAILEVQLRDESGSVSSQSDLQSMYSGAFTRFLNYVSSIEQRQRKRTMYSIANQLGIESFLVDLRHLCSHGKDSPSLDVFRRSAAYCMKWLKDFYWEREMKFIQDVDVTSVKVHNTIRFERNIRRLLLIYDAVTEALHNNCETHKELYTIVTDVERRDVMREYIAQLNESNVQKIFKCVVSDLFMAAKSRIVKESAYIFSEQLLRCPYFIKAVSSKDTRRSPLLKLHEKLFLEMQLTGIISTFFYKCVYVGEDPHENEAVRLAAVYWADKILEGLDLLQKSTINIRLDRYSSKQDLLKADNKAYTELVKFHKDKGIDVENTLILKNWMLNPIEITIDEEFLQRRIKNLYEVTGKLVKRIILMLDLQDEKYKKIMELISVVEIKGNNSKHDLQTDKIYSVEKDLLPLISNENKNRLEQKKCVGIFKEATRDIDWKVIPIGTIFEGTSVTKENSTE
ncbi:uncharacterized protein LOC134830490 [Culicoides brevitarsis]|uniref:uncharacterized protein LOC134830490 n=1 Tax=Culicoides brevitarsis TaxID=469753 RepID=UPI00307B18B6